MIAGRLHWKPRGAGLTGKFNLVAFDFSNGTLVLTEAGSKRRRGPLSRQRNRRSRQHDPGGLDMFAVESKSI